MNIRRDVSTKFSDISQGRQSSQVECRLTNDSIRGFTRFGASSCTKKNRADKQGEIKQRTTISISITMATEIWKEPVGSGQHWEG